MQVKYLTFEVSKDFLLLKNKTEKKTESFISNFLTSTQILW